MPPNADFSRPEPRLLEEQAGWLAPARARLLRRAGIARRRRVLDLACGSGAVTGELARRCGGQVLALDRSLEALQEGAAAFAGAVRLCADARRLPLADAAFDLVFCQFALVWLDVPAVLAEIYRVLTPGGVLLAIEPDYGGLIEHPPEITARELWLAALQRAGADPQVGRKLPGLLAAAGFRVEVDLLDRLESPAAARWQLLGGLPLTADEQQTLTQIEQADAAAAHRVAHLPLFLLTAEK